MKTITRAGILLATTVLSLGLLTNPAAAYADTSWGGCCSRVKVP